jgi:bifunctional UDP-N-acetylglucosamine pyrophosphorylase/glucosamine-1-phosphate N-acetyltransferase
MKVETVKADDASEVLGINDRDELARTEKILQRKIQRAHMLNGVTIVDPANTYIEAAVSIGRDTIIYPFSVIEGEVRIGAGCRIGPFSHIRGVSRVEDGAEIGNFVEVKTSLIGAGTKAKHLSYIGDAEIGKDANVGAGAITANYDGKAKHKTVIGDRAFIGSGTTLVAPVRVGKDAITGAGSVVLKGRDVPEGSVVVGIPAAEMRKKSG